MKRIHLFFIAVVLSLVACKKQAIKENRESPKLTFKSVEEIPNEIVPLLYNDLIRDGLTDQAENLRLSYYQTLLQRTDDKEDLLKIPYGNSEGMEPIMGANLDTRTVPNIGVVLDGNWFTTSGSTSCLVQDIGWTNIDFNAMNGTAPDAFSTTTPSGSQILGTTGLSKRMQAYTLPFVQYAVTDSLDDTYFTESVGFTYAAYLQDHGWQSYVTSSNMAGTLQAKRIQAIKIYGPSYGTNYTLEFNDAAPSTEARMYVYYRVHLQDNGWLNWVSENQVTGTTTQPLRLEAMQIRAYLIKV